MLVLALVATAAILPLAAARTGYRGCHCVVRMACCEDGTCTRGSDEPPATSPEWRSCRREVPANTDTAIDAFEPSAVGAHAGERIDRTIGRIAWGSIPRARSTPRLADPRHASSPLILLFRNSSLRISTKKEIVP